MKLLLLIILLAIFSASDAYGFINKGKSKNPGKQKKGTRTVRKNSAVKTNASSRKQPVSTVTLNSIMSTAKPVVTETALPPKVRSTVDKLHIIEKQHYHGNRELLIKHLQRQIALKKKQQLKEQSNSKLSPQTGNELLSQKQQSSTKQKQKVQKQSNGNENLSQKHNVITQDVLQPESNMQPATRERMQQKEIYQPVNKNTIELMPEQVDYQRQNLQIQHSPKAISQKADSRQENIQQNVKLQQKFEQTDVQSQRQHNPNNQQTVQLSLQDQPQSHLRQQPQQPRFANQNQSPVGQIQQQSQSNFAQDVNHIEQSFVPQQQNIQVKHDSQTISQKSHSMPTDIQQNVQHQQNFNQMTHDVQSQQQDNPYNRQTVQLSHQEQPQGNLRQQTQQQMFVEQNQSPVEQIQQQPHRNFAQDVNHIDQSFMPQKDLMQIQTQFQNRDNIQPQMQIQSMDLIKQQNAAYQTRGQIQKRSNIPKTQIHIQQMPQQQSSHIINQMQPALNQMLPRQHILMPLNSMSMDPLFQSQMMLPERIVFLNNAGNNNHVQAPTTPTPPLPTTTKSPMTKLPPTTARPITTRAPTIVTDGDPGYSIKSDTGNLREPGYSINRDTGNLQYQFFQKEMKKQDLEIMKLELEIRALKRAETFGTKEREREALKRTTTFKTTTTVHPFLAFGQKKFPFDF